MIIRLYHRGKSYFLLALPDELIHETYQRLKRIVNHNPENEVEYERLISVSKQWYYKKKYQCRYIDVVEKAIKSF